MSVHIDVLSRLHVLWGAFGVLTGTSLFILALGTYVAIGELGQTGPGGHAAVGVLTVLGITLSVGGAMLRRGGSGARASPAICATGRAALRGAQPAARAVRHRPRDLQLVGAPERRRPEDLRARR